MRDGAPKERQNLRTCEYTAPLAPALLGAIHAAGPSCSDIVRSPATDTIWLDAACRHHFCPRVEMSALASRFHFQAARNNSGIDMMIEVGDQALITLSLSRKEIERMLEAISNALDESKDDDLADDQ
jgi:hypothetical protein